jgi:heme-degrading monooxygenase HmoA
MYGPSGRWAALFRRGAGYGGTELFRGGAARVYLTLDRWESEAAYDELRTMQANAYAELDAAGDTLTMSETHIGSFHLVNAER